MRLCPRATVLATSREIMRIQGESAYRVPALDVPDSRARGRAKHPRLQRRGAVRHPGQGAGLGLLAAAGGSPVDRRDLPPPRRHPARHRVRRGPRRPCRNRAGGRRPARSLRAADQRTPHRDPAPPDLARHARLELPAAVAGRAAPAASPCPSSRRDSRSRPPRPSGHAAGPIRRSSRSCPALSPSRFANESIRHRRGGGCWRRYAPMRWRSSPRTASIRTPRAAMPDISAISSLPWRPPRAPGWTAMTWRAAAASSTMSGRRSTGRSRPTATSTSAPAYGCVRAHLASPVADRRVPRSHRAPGGGAAAGHHVAPGGGVAHVDRLLTFAGDVVGADRTQSRRRQEGAGAHGERR